MTHLVIIGNGISGVTVARHVRKRSDMKITIISAETKHFYSRTALMYAYMGHMKFENLKPYEDWFWEKNRIELVFDYVSKVDTDSKKLNLKSGKEISYDKLVLATGSKYNKFGWPGQDLEGVQGLFSWQDLELMEKNTANPVNRAVLVGGGLIGIEMAEMLLTRKIPVTFLVREDRYWGRILPVEEATLVKRHILEHGVDLRLNTELGEILPDENGRVKAVITKDGTEIPCQFVGLTAGVSPNIKFLEDSKVETGRGILVNDYLETNIPDIYSLGDCAEIKTPEGERNRLEQLWYTGRMQGEVLAKTIVGERTIYERGIWFNSAKFFDVEYQTYGQVFGELLEGEEKFYWEHEDHKHCLKVVFDEKTQVVIGLNVFGIRLRHDVCEKWLKEQRTLDYFLENLVEANFDPEFYESFEQSVADAYNKQFGKSLKAKTKKGFFASIFG